MLRDNFMISPDDVSFVQEAGFATWLAFMCFTVELLIVHSSPSATSSFVPCLTSDSTSFFASLPERQTDPVVSAFAYLEKVRFLLDEDFVPAQHSDKIAFVVGSS